MRPIRNFEPTPEKWCFSDVMAYLDCTEQKAKQIMEDCRKEKNIQGYGEIEKAVLLDFINEKQRIERERVAQYNANLASTRRVTALEEQVKILKEMCATSTKDARRAYIQSLIANFISGISIVIAILALAIK